MPLFSLCAPMCCAAGESDLADTGPSSRRGARAVPRGPATRFAAKRPAMPWERGTDVVGVAGSQGAVHGGGSGGPCRPQGAPGATAAQPTGHADIPDRAATLGGHPSARQLRDDRCQAAGQLDLRDRLCEEIRQFDKSILQPDGIPQFVSRAQHWLMPQWHGAVYVSGRGDSGRIYPVGAQQSQYMMSKLGYRWIQDNERVPPELIAALQPFVGRMFGAVEELMDRLREALGEQKVASLPESWQTYGLIIAGYNHAPHFVISAKTHGHVLKEVDGKTETKQHCNRYQRDDEICARQRKGRISYRPYPEIRHEHVRDAWRQALLGRRYLQERKLGLVATASEDVPALRERYRDAWGGDHPPAEWYRRISERVSDFRALPSEGKAPQPRGNCNSAVGTVLRMAARRQQRAQRREGLKPDPIPSIRSPKLIGAGAEQDVLLWDPLGYEDIE